MSVPQYFFSQSGASYKVDSSSRSGMGCFCTSPCVNLPIEDLAKWIKCLPVAELMNDGVIKLVGVNALFNPDSLISPDWLQGRMSVEDYR